MRALTVKNPYALLICAGVKDIENRSRNTNYRGKLLIHSSKTIHERFKNCLYDFTSYQSSEILKKGLTKLMIDKDYKYGCIIGEAEIVDCVKDSCSIWAEEGYFHWKLANAKLYDEPIENVKGQLGIWNYQPVFKYD